MSSIDEVLEFAETLLLEKTGTYCSILQRSILKSALDLERKTYDQLAKEYSYSANYVKQDVAPKLWQLLSNSLDQKVTKSNARGVLDRAMKQAASAKAASPVEPSQQQYSMTVAAFGTVPLAPETDSITTSKILIVDDRPENLSLLSVMLEQQGYNVRQAFNGSEALKAVPSDPPDLILLDIYMPGMDGYTVCQHLKAEPSTQDIPVIFVSALDEAWDKVQAFSAGGCDYITKPFKVVEVLARVESQLKIQHLQRRLRAQNALLQQANQELQRLAALDNVTQVANRQRFDTYLLQCWRQAQSSATSLTLMLCQVGNFNFYGEGGDPELGDRYLNQIAEAIKQIVRGAGDLVWRYGTTIFAIVLPELTKTEAEQVANSILQRINDLKMPEELSPLTLSIGIMTTLPASDAGLEDIVERCDNNLQEAKQRGGNCIIGA